MILTRHEWRVLMAPCRSPRAMHCCAACAEVAQAEANAAVREHAEGCIHCGEEQGNDEEDDMTKLETTSSPPLCRISTGALAMRLQRIREAAGEAWGQGFVDTDASRIIEELRGRDTAVANEVLAELFPEIEERYTCVVCGYTGERALDESRDEEGSDVQHTTDQCPRCGQHSVRRE